MEKTARRSVTRVQAGRAEAMEDALVLERELWVVAGRERFLLSSCSPGEERELAAGFLFSSGWIDPGEKILSVRVEGDTATVEVTRLNETERAPVPGGSAFSLPADELLRAAHDCQARGRVFQETGGTHAAALGHVGGLINFFEDISRTHALEKAVGDALLRGVALEETFVSLSCRINEQLLHRIARCGIPIVGAVSAPTLRAVEEAQRLGVCLCGFVRGERLTLYSHAWRVTS